MKNVSSWKLHPNYSLDDESTVIVDESGKEILGHSEWLRVTTRDLNLMVASAKMFSILKTLQSRDRHHDLCPCSICEIIRTVEEK